MRVPPAIRLGPGLWLKVVIYAERASDATQLRGEHLLLSSIPAPAASESTRARERISKQLSLNGPPPLPGGLLIEERTAGEQQTPINCPIGKWSPLINLLARVEQRAEEEIH